MSFIDKFLTPFQKGLRYSVSSFIQLETADNETTLASSDGSLVSYVKIDGSRQLIGEEEYQKIIDGATIKIGARFDRPGHALQVYFVRDPSRVGQVLKTQLRPARNTAKNSGLDLDDMFDEKVRHLQRFMTHEECYFVLWTRPSILTKSELERAGKESKGKGKSWLPAGYAQFPLAALEPLRARHKTFVSAILSAMDELGVRAQLLESHDALSAVRSNLFPDRANEKWRACLPGDPIPARAPMNKGDMSDLLWPPLPVQITAADARLVSPAVVRIGDLLWAGADMTLGPMEATAFPALMNRLADADIP
ncbi:MAG: type IV secretion protein IcmB, partial [Alphaproteobacteria bacterium]|nr:type IV secretion protein IcmB [Alphaproteobacteria bacterium]